MTSLYSQVHCILMRLMVGRVKGPWSLSIKNAPTILWLGSIHYFVRFLLFEQRSDLGGWVLLDLAYHLLINHLNIVLIVKSAQNNGRCLMVNLFNCYGFNFNDFVKSHHNLTYQAVVLDSFMFCTERLYVYSKSDKFNPLTPLCMK